MSGANARSWSQATARAAVPDLTKAMLAFAARQKAHVPPAAFLVEIPALSARTQDALQAVISDMKSWRSLLAQDPHIVGECMQLDRAIAERFGSDALRKLPEPDELHGLLDRVPAVYDGDFKDSLPVFVAVRQVTAAIAKLQPAGHVAGTESVRAENVADKCVRVVMPHTADAGHFQRIVGHSAATFKDGAWEMRLPADERGRDSKISDINAALKHIIAEVRAAEAKQRLAMSVVGACKSNLPNLDVSVRNGAVAVTLPPIMCALEALRGAGWIYPGEAGSKEGYWSLDVRREADVVRIPEMLTRVQAHVTAEFKTPSLARAIDAPSPEIRLVTDGNKLSVKIASMPEAIAILTAPGLGNFDRHNTGACTIVVDRKNSAAVARRLAAVHAFHQTGCLIKPHNGRPGIPHLSNAQEAAFASSGAKNYVSNTAIKDCIDGYLDAVNTALTHSDHDNLNWYRDAKNSAAAQTRPVPERFAGLAPKVLIEFSLRLHTLTVVKEQGQAILRTNEQAIERSRDYDGYSR